MDNQNKLDITALKSEIKLPDFKEIEVVSYSNYFDNFWDSLKVEQYNETLISTVLQMNEINNQINDYTQKKVKTIRELTQKANQLRLELDTLKTIGFNIRQEMKL